MSTRSFRRLAAAALNTSAVLALIAGCGGSSKPAPSSAPTTPTMSTATTSSAAPSSPDPTAQAKSGALDTYRKVLALTTEELASNQELPDLLTYAQSNAYLYFHNTLIGQMKGGIVFTGTPQSSPTVTKVDMATTPPSVTIGDCFGGPNYKPVFAADGGGYKKGQSALSAGTTLVPHVVTAVLEDKDGHWVMIKYAVSSTAC